MTGPILSKAWIFEGPNGSVEVRKAASTSQQLPQDPFSYGSEGEGGLVRPIYDLDLLVSMLEGNTLHARCVRQKATDVAGRGFSLEAAESVDAVPTATEDRWGQFLTAVEEDERGDESFGERITQAHQDYESVGWAALEFSRGQDGTIDGMWHVPGHTVRAHQDSRRYAQKRGGKTVWFKRYGLEGTVDRRDGGWSDRTSREAFAANELLVIRNYTPRSDFYGLPDHIPALAAIAGWRAQAEFNVRWFENNAVPSYAVVVEGADITPELEQTIIDHFRAIKGDPNRTIVIPIPGATGDEGSAPRLRFERLSAETKEASFRLFKQDNALEICISHGMPPYRVGWPIVGSLGGSTAVEMTQIYNETVVEPRQETWEQRLNRALLGAKGLNVAGAQLKAKRLDTRDMTRDVLISKALYEMNSITPAAIAKFYGLDERKAENGGDLYLDQLQASRQPSFGGFGNADPIDAALLEKAWSAEVRELSAIRKRIAEIVDTRLAA